MKRKDAIRKLRTICQRLNELSPDEFKIQPLRLYLFGSVLTDKPDPNDIDTVLTYEHLPDFDYEAVPMELAYGKPTASERLVIKLRRGMQKVRIYLARDSLRNWEQSGLLVFSQTRLIWKPGGNWQVVLAKMEAEPLSWTGPRTPDTHPDLKTLIETMPEGEFQAQLSQALAEIEAQDL